MKTGDVVLDAQGRSYQVGPLLGRGLWGKSYLVRHGDSRAEFVLKCPLARDDFRGDVPLTDRLLSACEEACKEQAEILSEGTHAFFPPLQSRQGSDGSPLLILPRFTTTLDRRIDQGSPLTEVLGVLLATLKHLHALEADASMPSVHGNLRPSNILLNDRGEVLLTDLATPTSEGSLGQLHALSSEPNRYLPPEALRGGPLTPVADTYALAMSLYRAIMTPVEGITDGRSAIELPTEGLNKAALVELKDKTIERLQAEDSNPRFHQLFAERVASVLNRALSLQVQPSPPFRFLSPLELGTRLSELKALIRPTITSVGKAMLSRPPSSTTFETDGQVGFSVTVAASEGVDKHEEIAVGIAVFDQDSGERVRDCESAYTCERHPSGRFRFVFQLMELPPARYRTRVAFAIRDSGHPPSTSEADFEVRAAAGYVPPRRAHTTQPLPFSHEDSGDNTAVTQPRADLEEPVAPRPVAPPDLPKAPPPPALSTPRPQVHPSWEDELPAPSVPAPRPSVGYPEPTEDMPAAPPAHGWASQPEPEPELTEPAVTVGTQLPQADPLRDILGKSSWADVPLPGEAGQDLGPPPLDDIDDPSPETPLRRILEQLKGDLYLQLMVGAGALILVLILVLLILR